MCDQLMIVLWRVAALLCLGLTVTTTAQAKCEVSPVASLRWAYEVNRRVVPTSSETARTALIVVKTRSGCATDEIEAIRRSLARALSQLDKANWRPVAMNAPAQEKVFDYIEKVGLANLDASTFAALDIQPPNYVISVFLDFGRVSPGAGSPWILPKWTFDTEALEVPTGVLLYPSKISYVPETPSEEGLTIRVLSKETGRTTDGRNFPIYSPFVEVRNPSPYVYCLLEQRTFAISFNHFRDSPGKALWTQEMTKVKLLEKDVCVDPQTIFSFRYIRSTDSGSFPYCVVPNASDDLIEMLALRRHFTSFGSGGATFNAASSDIPVSKRLNCFRDEILDPDFEKL